MTTLEQLDAPTKYATPCREAGLCRPATICSPLVLSIFPGIGMLDMAFEDEGYTVVRGPDVLWGGDVHDFHPPAGIFRGVIGGPPCQAHVRYAALNRSIGNKVAEDLIPQFIRVVLESEAEWFLMENSSLVPAVKVSGYQVQGIILTAALFGLEQDRKRKFQYGSRTGRRIKVTIPALSVPQTLEKACLASEGGSGVISNRRVNGVPLPMGRAIARAVYAENDQGEPQPAHRGQPN